MKIRGITDGRMREVVERTLDSQEWAYDGLSGTTHGILRHIPSGETVTFGLPPSSGAFKTIALKVRKISGLTVWRQSSRRPGRKAAATGWIDPERVADEQERFRETHPEWSGTYTVGIPGEALAARHDELLAELRELTPDRMGRAREIASDLIAMEAELDRLNVKYQRAV